MAGGPPDSNPELLTRGTGPFPEWIIRDFTGGMHVNPTRDAIAEQDLWWMENLQPIASGNVVPVGAFGAGAAVTGVTYNGAAGVPYYTTQVNIGTVPGPAPYLFSCFPDGSAWITPCNPAGGAGTQIMAPGTLASNTYAVNWMGSTRAGFLIIDPNGYWDYNLTTAATLTKLSNVITGATNTYKTTVAGGTALHQVFISGALTPPAQVQTHYTVTSGTINAAGTGYVVGDVVSLTDNNPFTPAQVTITNTGGGGTVTGVSLNTGGDYPGPNSTAAVVTGPTGNVVTGGTGTGLTFHVDIQATKVVIVTEGPGTTNPVSFGNYTATPTAIDDWNIATGNINGTSIATYAGRVWIGNNNTISYTDINSYNAFGGAGGSATFSDQYLVAGITVLYSINNYLYMFGATSVDLISNVTVNANTGVTSFSRVNVLQGLGCVQNNNMTVAGFGRGVVFLDLTGFYMLAGATPERISERIQACIRAGGINISNPVSGLPRPSVAIDNENQELCLALQFVVNDSFSDRTTQAQRVLVFIYQRHRWWVASDFEGDKPGLNMIGPIAGLSNWANNIGAYRLQTPNASLPNWSTSNLFTGDKHWQLRTKLWDGGKNFSEKQAVNASISAQWNNPGPGNATGVTFQIDSELHNTSPVLGVPNIPTLFTGQYPYNTITPFATQTLQSVMATAQAYGSQYIGLTFFGVNVFGATPLFVLEGIALRGKQERNMLE